MLKCNAIRASFFWEVLMNKLFKLQEAGTTVGTEVRAGLTTFFAMAYIIFLNPVFLSATGMDSEAVLIATCISAAIGSLICAFISNKPFAMASGMGMNAFFAYTLCGGYGFTWQQALAITFISGILFLIVSLVLGEKAIKLIPDNLKHAITVGIGLFIALIGMLDGGLLDLSTGVPALANISSPTVLISLAGLAIILILTVRKVKGSLIIGMAITIILSLLTGQTQMPGTIFSMPTAISRVAFKLDFGLLNNEALVGGFIALISIIISMTIVDMFDTLGFLIGTASNAGMLEGEEGKKSLSRVVTADALSTVVGSLFGTSTVTVYAESASGIAAGGKTGLTAFVTAICFLLATFFSPIASIVTSAATAPVLIVVGMYLMMDIVKINVNDFSDLLPVFLTVMAIPFTYSITTGIAAGFIAHVICKAGKGAFKEIQVSDYILVVIFVLYFVIK